MIIFAFFAKINFAQNSVNAAVVAVIEQGGYSYAILSETGTSNTYQTSAYYSTQGTLINNQQISLSFDNINDKSQGLVVANTISNLYCFLNAQSSNLNPISVSNPILSNDILFFDDREHVNEFHDYLEELVNNSNNDQFELLDSIEGLFIGYESHRTDFEDQHNLQTGSFSSQELETIIESDFVRDEVLKTMLNHNRMIGIGDSVYFWRQENVILSFLATKTNLISSLAATPDSVDIYGKEGLLDLIGDAQDVNVWWPGHYGPPVGDRAVLVVSEDLSYESQPILQNYNCEVYKKALMVQLNETFFDGYYSSYTIYDLEESATLTILWDDDDSTIIENYDGQWIEHTYGDLGDYYPITKLEFFDRNGDSRELRDTSGVGFKVKFACTEDDLHIVQYAISGSYQMVSELFVQHNWIFHQIGGRTSFYENNGSGFERERCDLYAKVNGTFRDNDCTIKETKEEYKLKRLRYDVQADKTKTFKNYDVMNGDVFSRHYCVKGGLFLEVNLVLNPCPE